MYPPARVRSSRMRAGRSGFAARPIQIANSASRTTPAARVPHVPDGMPAVCCCVRETEHDAEQSTGGQQQAGNIQLELLSGCLTIEQQDPADERDACEDEVDVERPTPGEIVGQCAAEQQADRASTGGDRAEDAERFGPVLRRGERGDQERQRRRHQHGAEHALEGSSSDERREVRRRATDGRDAGEPDQTDQEGGLAAEEIAELPSGEQKASGREAVGRHDPLPIGGREVQRALRRRQRDVHHRQVENHHELRGADHAERQPAFPVGARVGNCCDDSFDCAHGHLPPG